MHEFHKTSLSFFTIHICFQLFVFCRSRYLCVSYNTLILKISKFPIVHRFFFYSHYYLCVENPFLSRKRGSLCRRFRQVLLRIAAPRDSCPMVSMSPVRSIMLSRCLRYITSVMSLINSLLFFFIFF